MKTTLLCPAKINLYLAILEKDESGYHKLDTIFVRTEQLEDKIHITPADQFSLEVICPNTKLTEVQPANPSLQDIPTDQSNTLLKVIDLLQEKTGKSFNYKITLEKHIPVQSGLGGASSNAASLLIFLNEKEGLHLTHMELLEIGRQIGKDTPFFLSGHPVARGTQYGDEITALPELPKSLNFKIHPGSKTSTQDAFSKWDEFIQYPSQAAKVKTQRPPIETFLTALENQDSAAILQNLHNDFQWLSSKSRPIKIASADQVPRAALLSGSGGAVVVFDDSDMKVQTDQA
jgi:4-diphosphocytidyl-2C-methyl-D-erythritol kinase